MKQYTEIPDEPGFYWFRGELWSVQKISYIAEPNPEVVQVLMDEEEDDVMFVLVSGDTLIYANATGIFIGPLEPPEEMR